MSKNNQKDSKNKVKDSIKPRKIIRDNIHGYIEIDQVGLCVISTPIFQRLRHIIQNGFTYLVYPGMTYNRFLHSLGVAHLARRIILNILQNNELYGENLAYNGFKLGERLYESLPLFEFAALIHDIGHLSFSHTFEMALKDYNLWFAEQSEKLPEKHEAFLEEILDILLEEIRHSTTCNSKTNFIKDVLDCQDEEELKENIEILFAKDLPPSKLQEIEKEKPELIIYRSLISGSLDIDKMDYLLRDAHYSGSQHGYYDLERLSRVMIIITPESQARTKAQKNLPNIPLIVILEKGLAVLEDFLWSRVYMYNEVYNHNIVLAYNYMAARLIALLIKREKIELPFNNSGLDRDKFQNMTDYNILHIFHEEYNKLKEKINKKEPLDNEEKAIYLLAKGILYRKHFKYIEDKILKGEPADSKIEAITTDEKIKYQIKQKIQEKPWIIPAYFKLKYYSSEALENILIYDRKRKEVKDLTKYSLIVNIVKEIVKYAKFGILYPDGSFEKELKELKIPQQRIPSLFIGLTV